MTTSLAPSNPYDTADEVGSPLSDRPSWMAFAVCPGRTNLFFGSTGERPQRRARREARARKLCLTCPVLEECREQARQNRENGFWGGESEEERAAAGYPPLVISRRSVQWAANEGEPMAIAIAIRSGGSHR